MKSLAFGHFSGQSYRGAHLEPPGPGPSRGPGGGSPAGAHPPGRDHTHGEAHDPQTAFFYTPRSLTALAWVAGLLAVTSGAVGGGRGEGAGGARAGTGAMVVTFLVYSALYAPDTTMIRPHPVVWRVVHGVSMCYLLCLIFLLYLRTGEARLFLRHFSAELGAPLEERDYGGDCRIFTPEHPDSRFAVLKATVFDEFVLAHTLGWWAKAITVRNYALLLTISVGFELMELTFRHCMPNFNECWWDSWVLDVLICNNVGLLCGMMTAKYFGSRFMDWRGLSQHQTLKGKVLRSLQQFTPHTWDKFDWQVTSGPKRFVQCLLLVAGMLLVELNSFFLKYVLWIPPRNPLNTIRLLLWWGVAVPAVREYYYYIEKDESDLSKLGAFSWLAFALIIVEVLIGVKHGRGLFPQAWPRPVLAAWGLGVFAVSAFLVTWSLARWKRERRGKQKQKRSKSW